MSEIQADGADHEAGQDVIEEIVEMDVNVPDWFLENFEILKEFLAMDEEERNELVGEASGVFGTVLASLTPEGIGALVASGDVFAQTNYDAMKEKFGDMQGNQVLLLLLGVAIECMGIQQYKIAQAKKQ